MEVGTRNTFQVQNLFREMHIGYLIPKGWRVMVVHTTFHLDAQNYPSPNKFDHNRFEVSLQYNNLLISLFTLYVD